MCFSLSIDLLPLLQMPYLPSLLAELLLSLQNSTLLLPPPPNPGPAEYKALTCPSVSHIWYDCRLLCWAGISGSWRQGLSFILESTVLRSVLVCNRHIDVCGMNECGVSNMWTLSCQGRLSRESNMDSLQKLGVFKNHHSMIPLNPEPGLHRSFFFPLGE